ncbi:hypothetical protein ACI3PF_08535, partial [Lactococcus lactis]
MNAIELVQGAMKKAEKIRPKVGGFPYLAECMREAGVLKNVWTNFLCFFHGALHKFNCIHLLTSSS